MIHYEHFMHVVPIYMLHPIISGNFTKVGNNMLLMIDETLDYNDAKTSCADLGSQLVEFQNLQEYAEVI